MLKKIYPGFLQGFYDKKYISDCDISCFKTLSEKLKDKPQNLKVVKNTDMTPQQWGRYISSKHRLTMNKCSAIDKEKCVRSNCLQYH